ncbi:DUF4190 domain-containing protein [Streptomyces sp. NPDC051130]|uniref:DUF4190 domain-containing protein n=1 Tax=Streptomyces sp. NPDC051130 TaxID=3157223 RepID=UPI00343E8505
MSTRSTADHPVRTDPVREDAAERPAHPERPVRAERTEHAARSSDAARTPDAAGPAASTATATGARTRSRTRDADGMAVASFLLGLIGLLAMNLLLGPASMVLAVLALRRGTTRPGRARLGFALGVADLVVLACLVGADHTWSWSV